MNYPKHPEIQIYLKDNFEKNILKILNYPGISYSYYFSKRNATISDIGKISDLDYKAENHSFSANFKELSFFDVFTSKDKHIENDFVIFFSRLFQSPFKVVADYWVPNDFVFDTERYLQLIFGMCKDVLISDIIVMSNEEIYYESQTFQNPTPNSLVAIIGKTYKLTSGYYYVSKLLNNLLDEDAHTLIYKDSKGLEPLEPCFDYTDDARLEFYDKLGTELDKKEEITVLIKHYGYLVTVIVQSEKILMVPYLPHKTKKTEGAEGVDIQFYTELLTKMCRGIAICDFETYFNRPDSAYVPWPLPK